MFETITDLPNIKVGDVVTFEYDIISTIGTPKPKLVRVRSDLSWHHVLHDHYVASSVLRMINVIVS